MENLREMYRFQSRDDINSFINSAYPIRRVIVGCDGDITLNPNSEQFIYFSRSKKHHEYYIFNKVFKIIAEEIKRAKKDPYFSKLDLPENFRIYRNMFHLNNSVIKQVQNFFTNYLPPQKVELVTLQYLNAFYELLEQCAIKQKLKDVKLNIKCPEISDTKANNSGAYGINDLWLELLKECLVSTEVCTMSVTDILEEIKNFKNTLPHNSTIHLDDFRVQTLAHLTYNKLQNPKFQGKNKVNNIINLLELIEENNMYSPLITLDKDYFTEQRKIFKEEYHNTIEQL